MQRYNYPMPKPNRQPFLVAVHAFFIRDNQVLLLERANSGYMDGYWSVPAGHVDGGETIWEAMQREIEEETDILIAESLKPAHVMHRMKQTETEERIDYFFKVTAWHGTPCNNEPEKCADLCWFKTNELPEKMVPYVQFGLEQVLDGKLFSEFAEA